MRGLRFLGFITFSLTVACLMPAPVQAGFVGSYFGASLAMAGAETGGGANPIPFWCFAAQNRDGFKSCASGYLQKYRDDNRQGYRGDRLEESDVGGELELAAKVYDQVHATGTGAKAN